MHRDFGDIFVCPVCSSAELVSHEADLTCGICGKTFGSKSGIPILVTDPEKHEKEMQAAQVVNPDWYLTEQPPEAASPWRHHLKKRRLYVEGVLQDFFLQRQWKKAPKILDLGCGDGTNLIWLADYGDRVYGSDYNLTRLTRAHHRSADHCFFLADILNYPVCDNAFDVVYFNHVLEHIPDDEAALRQVRRILKPDGLLILGTPNEGAWWWQLAYQRAPDVFATTDHVHFYTGKTLAAKVKKAGFEVQKVHHMGWGPPSWRLDGLWRQHKWVDDWFERVGKIVIPKQASSLYITAS